MDLIKLILIIILILFLIRLLQKLFKVKPRKKFRRLKPRKKIFLKAKTKAKADRKYYKLLNKLRKDNNKEPTKDKKFRIVINASHITIRYRKGKSGHWGRQKVRKYLLEKHNIVKNYIMK